MSLFDDSLADFLPTAGNLPSPSQFPQLGGEDVYQTSLGRLLGAIPYVGDILGPLGDLGQIVGTQALVSRYLPVPSGSSLPVPGGLPGQVAAGATTAVIDAILNGLNGDVGPQLPPGVGGGCYNADGSPSETSLAIAHAVATNQMTEAQGRAALKQLGCPVTTRKRKKRRNCIPRACARFITRRRRKCAPKRRSCAKRRRTCAPKRRKTCGLTAAQRRFKAAAKRYGGKIPRGARL